MAGKITPGSGAGRGGFPWGPQPQIFSASSLSAARALRDAHAQANPDWIQEFVDDLADDSKPDRVVGLRDTTENTLTLEAYRSREASYTSIFGATVGGVTLPAKPEEDLVGDREVPFYDPGAYYEWYRFDIISVAAANQLVTELNRAFDAGTPHVIRDTANDREFVIVQRSEVAPDREQRSAWGQNVVENDGTTSTFPAAPASTARAPYVFGTRTQTIGAEDGAYVADVYVTEVDMSAAALTRINSLVSIWNDGATASREWRLNFTDSGGNSIFSEIIDVRGGNNGRQHHYVFTVHVQSGTQTVNGDVTGLTFAAQFVTQWRVRMPTKLEVDSEPLRISEGDWDVQDLDYAYSWETVGGTRGGGGIFERGPEPNYFTAATLAAAETLRNTQAHDLTEAAWIKAYRDARDSEPLRIIFLESTDDQQITIQTFHETETSYATIFGVEYGSVTMPAKPSANLFIDVDSNDGPTFRFATTRANVLALVTAANAARAALDPWVVKTIDTDTNTIRLALRADTSMRVDRAQSSIWGATFLDESGTSRTISTYSLPSHGNEPFIRTDSSTSKRYLRIPEGGGGGATRRVDATLAVWAVNGNAGGTRPWNVSFRDSGGSGRTAGVAALTRGTLSGQYHYYDFELDSTLATATTDGNITNMAITGNFPTAYQLLLPVENEAEGVASSNNVVPSVWDFEDRDYSHSWRTIGAMTGALGLDQDAVDARISALVEQFALDTTTAIPGARIATGSLAEGKLATTVRTKLNATALTLLTGDTTWTADQTAAASGKIFYFVGDSNATLTMARPSGSGDIAFLAVNATGAFATFTLDATPDAARVAPLALRTASEVGVAIYDSDLNRWELHHLSSPEIITADRTFTAAEVQFFDTRTIVCQPSSDITITHPQPSPDSDRAIRYINLTGNDSSVTLTTSTAGLRDRTLEIPQGQTATGNYDSANDKWTWVGAWELGNIGFVRSFRKRTTAGDAAAGEFVRTSGRNVSFGLQGAPNLYIRSLLLAGLRFYDRNGTAFDVQSWTESSGILTAVLTSGSVGTIDSDITTFEMFANLAPRATDVQVDASGFDGNLATTDTTVQAVAQKVDDLTVSGSGSQRAFGAMQTFARRTATGDAENGEWKRVAARSLQLGFGTGGYVYDLLKSRLDRIYVANAGGSKTRYDVASVSEATGSGGNSVLNLTLRSTSSTIDNSLTGLTIHWNYDRPAADIAVDSSGFSGNLGSGDNTVQAVADAVDGLSGGTGTSTAASETAAGIVELATAAEARTGSDDERAITPEVLRSEFDHYFGVAVGDQDVYFGALAADPTTTAQIIGLESTGIPDNGEQELEVGATWTGGARRFYIAQVSTVDDIDRDRITIDGLRSTGWTAGSLTVGGTTYEWVRSQYTWESASAQGVRIGVKR